MLACGVSYTFGALARGNTASTVEHRAGIYLLACVRGALATPALESIKSTFYDLAGVDDAAARAVCAAAPSMIADAVAVVLIADGRAHVACAGGGVVLRQRDGATAPIDGAHALAAGDDLIASCAPLPIAGGFFASPAAAPTGGFRNDAIDAELAVAAAAIVPTGAMAIAALRLA
jgi:hypothetical protein